MSPQINKTRNRVLLFARRDEWFGSEDGVTRKNPQRFGGGGGWTWHHWSSNTAKHISVVLLFALAGEDHPSMTEVVKSFVWWHRPQFNSSGAHKAGFPHRADDTIPRQSQDFSKVQEQNFRLFVVGFFFLFFVFFFVTFLHFWDLRRYNPQSDKNTLAQTLSIGQQSRFSGEGSVGGWWHVSGGGTFDICKRVASVRWAA